MTISKATFDNAWNELKSGSAQLEIAITDVMVFCYEQATGENANSSPAMKVREELSDLPCKPARFTQKRLDAFMLERTGFEWSAKSYKRGSTVPVDLPVQGVRFWQYDEAEVIVLYSLVDAVARLVKKATKEGKDASEIIDAFSVQIADLTPQPLLDVTAA